VSVFVSTPPVTDHILPRADDTGFQCEDGTNLLMRRQIIRCAHTAVAESLDDPRNGKASTTVSVLGTVCSLNVSAYDTV
jgi:hypothetical protein